MAELWLNEGGGKRAQTDTVLLAAAFCPSVSTAVPAGGRYCRKETTAQSPLLRVPHCPQWQGRGRSRETVNTSQPLATLPCTGKLGFPEVGKVRWMLR